jgi:hypothetical protein
MTASFIDWKDAFVAKLVSAGYRKSNFEFQDNSTPMQDKDFCIAGIDLLSSVKKAGKQADQKWALKISVARSLTSVPSSDDAMIGTINNFDDAVMSMGTVVGEIQCRTEIAFGSIMKVSVYIPDIRYTKIYQ